MPGSKGKASSSESLTRGFAPILGNSPRVLVLGTLPSIKSLEKHQYYGHPQNGFWKIMATLVGATGDYAERQAALKRAGVAVWDVLGASVRPGSMDADIDLKTAAVNPLVELVNDHTSIRKICFNGQKSRQLFDRLVDTSSLREGVMLETLPSTSPAYASMSLEEKTRRWADALAEVLEIDTPQ